MLCLSSLTAFLRYKDWLSLTAFSFFFIFAFNSVIFLCESVFFSQMIITDCCVSTALFWSCIRHFVNCLCMNCWLWSLTLTLLIHWLQLTAQYLTLCSVSQCQIIRSLLRCYLLSMQQDRHMKSLSNYSESFFSFMICQLSSDSAVASLRNHHHKISWAVIKQCSAKKDKDIKIQSRVDHSETFSSSQNEIISV